MTKKGQYMNRLTAHKRRYMIENMTTDEKMIDLIDEIYDDLESQTCKNCRYYIKKNGEEHCSSGFMNGTIWDNTDTSVTDPIFYPDEDFGCNQFEKRDT